MTVDIHSGVHFTLPSSLLQSRDGFYTLFPHYIPIPSYARMETLVSWRVPWTDNNVVVGQRT